MNQIDQIKDILFSNEKRALDALTRRIEKRESRVADIADVLPESIGRSHTDGDRLNKALRIPVEECLTDSIARDPQTFADALFPVMGPAIRKSISETLKAFTESINQAIEEKTSLKSFKWRMQAKKAGIPYAQFLITRNLEYRVDHAYLIEPKTGLLISDAHRQDAVRKDDDAIAAMLAAIQDFVRESFGDENEGTLETADLGHYSLWTMQGPSAMLACVINGVPPRNLREQFMQVLERIHLQFGEVLDSFDGSQTDRTRAIEPQLEECLLDQVKEGIIVSEKKKSVGSVGVLAVLGLAALAWFGWQNFQLRQAGNELIERLESEPGIFLTQSNYADGKINIKGLRDSAALSPQQLAIARGIDPEQLNLQFTPFHSLEKSIQERRVKERLVLPQGVSMNLTDTGVLAFSGEISPTFKSLAEDKLQGMLGISSLRFGKIVYTDAALLDSATQILQPPESVDLAVDNAVLSVNGIAPYAWKKQLLVKQKQIVGLERVEASGLQVSELAQIEALETEVNNEIFMFVWRTNLNESGKEKIVGLSGKLKVYGQLLEQLNIEPEIILTGFTDRTGSEEQNLNLLMERALYVKGRLVGQGVRSKWIFVRSGNMRGPEGLVDPTERKVVVTLDADLSSFE